MTTSPTKPTRGQSVRPSAVPAGAPRAQACPVCSGPARTFFEARRVPVHTCVMQPTREQALAAPTGDLILAFCGACGYIWNHAFDEAKLAYGEAYDNALGFSGVYAEYARALADELIDRYGLRGKDVLEIGCGAGDFLAELCRRGRNRGVGYDPSYIPGADLTGLEPGQIEFVREYYGEQHADRPVDFVCCRQVFEHIPDTRPFLESLRRTLGDRSDCIVCFEVPNTLFPLRDLSIWDMIYEHCAYFTSESLAASFEMTGFDVLNVREVFDGQYLVIEACPGATKRAQPSGAWGDVERLAGYVDAFARQFTDRVGDWKRRLRDLDGRGERVVLWGAGARGVSFLNAVKDVPAVEYAVDVNRRKHGKFLPGSGQEIIAPERLADLHPDHVILMNPIYEDEIRASIESMGLRPEYHRA